MTIKVAKWDKNYGCHKQLATDTEVTTFDGRVWCADCHTKERPASRYHWYERGKMPRDGYCGAWVV